MDTPPETLSRGAAENLSKLKQKLRELFQLDRGDLDFGLYRVMAFKSAEVGDFLNDDLLPQVTEKLGEIAQSDTGKLQKELAQETQEAKKHLANPEDSPRVKELKAQLSAAKRDQRTEADTYNHLCNFFSRYYDEGDFMSLRRYKNEGKEAYAIPYNGEEVKLHWANADQYYIKTTENYASYVFRIDTDGKQRVRFEIAEADNEKDNIQEANGNKRHFILAKDFIAEADNELIIRFDHRPLTDGEKTKYPQNGIRRQEAINKDAEQRILKKLTGHWLNLLAALLTTEKEETRTLLGKHLTTYTAKNSFDYFIHKDLGGFLRRELDYYLKSEVISIDNLELADDPRVFIRGLAQIKAIKHIGGKIIDFLAQLEDFQKQLWLKKKFVLETQYCVTLDKVPESLYAEIVKNKAQHAEWVKLFAIDELKGDLATVAYSKSLKPEFLKANPYLVLDTRHFDQSFTDKLLAALSEAGPIEEQMNGLLVHGENFQALNLMQERYRGQVKCIHIDPPYNTDTSGFLYKNGYRHSSWLSMMESRLSLSMKLMSIESSCIQCHIDENEYERLFKVFSSFHLYNQGTIIWDKANPLGGSNKIASQHEYVICQSLGNLKLITRKHNANEMMKKADKIARSKDNIALARIKFKEWVKSNGKLNGSEKGFNELDDDGRVYQTMHMGAPEQRSDAKYFKPLAHPITGRDCPVPARGWSNTPEFMDDLIKNNLIHWGKDESTQPRKISYLDEMTTGELSSVLRSGARGKKQTDSLGIDFPYCHHSAIYEELIFAIDNKDSLTLDYFAGSGTTGHAVVSLNRQDNGNRKCILVEMGDHFETALLPRMKKVTYSKEWKDGKPKDRDGVSQLFKYIRTESYEDTLDSLTVKKRDDSDLVAAAEHKQFIEDYQLRYALSEETATSASLLGKDFIDPFDYSLSVVRDGIRRDVTVDLAETFNFLLGLRLTGRRQVEDVLTITGTTAKGENCLILWRNLEKMDAAKLDKWFAKHHKNFNADLNLIYVNGDHTLNALRKSGDKWEAITTEPVFRELMFEDDR